MVLRCDRGITDAQKWIQHGSDARRSVQFDRPFGQLNRKCRRMRPFFLAALNCFVGDEPRVPAATQIFSPSMRPTRDVALILIRNAKRQPIQFDTTGLREMKNIFVAIVEKSRRIDRLKWPNEPMAVAASLLAAPKLRGGGWETRASPTGRRLQ